MPPRPTTTRSWIRAAASTSCRCTREATIRGRARRARLRTRNHAHPLRSNRDACQIGPSCWRPHAPLGSTHLLPDEASPTPHAVDSPRTNRCPSRIAPTTRPSCRAVRCVKRVPNLQLCGVAAQLLAPELLLRCDRAQPQQKRLEVGGGRGNRL